MSHRRSLTLMVSLAAVLSTAASAAGQARTTGHAAEPGAPPLRVTIDDAVRLALEHNLDLAVDRLEPEVSTARVAQAVAAFVPSLGSVFTRTSQVQPPTSFLVGSNGVQTDVYSGSITLGQRLPWLGTSVAVGFDASRTATTSTFTNFNPSLTGRLQVTVSQPLVRDRPIDNARQQLVVTRRNREISDTRLRETVVRTVDGVKRAYWDLVAARASVDVQQQSLALAQELARLNSARVTVGQSPDIDLVAAQAEVAQRREALTVAQVNARQAEDRLRTLILDPGQPDFWTTSIAVTDQPPVGGPLPDMDSAVRDALGRRQDLIRARKELENAQTATRYYSNQRLPDVRLQANYQASGLAGTRLIRTGGFPGTVTGQEVTPFTQALDQVGARAFPAWTVGVTVSYPLGRGFEAAGLAAARLQEAQARARLQSLEVRIVRQIRQAAWQLEMNASRIQTSRMARELAERRADAEQKRFEVGMSTSFLVVQAQRDLAQARNNELAVVLDYTRSLTDFEALLDASLDQSGSTVTVSGASVTAAGAVPATAAQASQAATSSTASRLGGM